jgi:hypothetical protein
MTGSSSRLFSFYQREHQKKEDTGAALYITDPESCLLHRYTTKILHAVLLRSQKPGIEAVDTGCYLRN